MKARKAYSLTELLLIIGLIAVLLALLLPAVQKVRETAVRLSCQNKVRQVALGIVNYTTAHDDKLPPPPGHLTPPPPFAYFDPPGRPAVFPELWPFVSGGSSVDHSNSTVYRCPADNSFKSVGRLAWPVQYSEPVTYCLNYHILWGNNRPEAFSVHSTTLSSYVTDGLSSTAIIRERYQWCKDTWRPMSRQFTDWDGPTFLFIANDIPIITVGSPLRTTTAHFPGVPYPPGATFQPQPPLDRCHPGMTQGLHAAGQVQGMCDGSVRILSPRVSDWVYWGQATPNAGDQCADD